MEQRKNPLSSPSLQTGLSPQNAAGDPVCAPLSACGSPQRNLGAPFDRSANTCCSPVPTRVAPAPDYPGSRYHPAAWRAASAAVGCADTLPSRNTSDRELADTAERPPRTRHTAAPPSMRLRSANQNGVRYRSAVNGLVTNSGAAPWEASIRFNSNQRVPSREHRVGLFRRAPTDLEILATRVSEQASFAQKFAGRRTFR